MVTDPVGQELRVKAHHFDSRRLTVFGELRPNGFVDAVIIPFDLAQVMLRQFGQLLHKVVGRTLAGGVVA